MISFSKELIFEVGVKSTKQQNLLSSEIPYIATAVGGII